ncbi:putative mannose-6-phosphate 6-reductase [Helianthus debilis subsp. tardiflorus]
MVYFSNTITDFFLCSFVELRYLDLFLVHFPIATKHTVVGTTASALDEEGVLDIDPTI